MKKAHVLSGIDRIGEQDDLLRGRRVGLMTNPTGFDHSFRSAIDILHQKYGLSAMYAVEHGIRGDAGFLVRRVDDGLGKRFSRLGISHVARQNDLPVLRIRKDGQKQNGDKPDDPISPIPHNLLQISEFCPDCP